MTIDQLNRLNETKAFEAFEQCCGASRWVDRMIVGRPYEDLNEMLEISDRVWEECDVDDYQESFTHHSPIAVQHAHQLNGDQKTLDLLIEAGQKYEERFGHTFILCATGKSPAEMLKVIEMRLKNEPEKEILIAAEEQNKITRMRLKKLLHTTSDTIATH